MNKKVFIKFRPSPELISEGPVARKHFEATKSLMTALAGLLADEPITTISLELSSKNGAINYIVGVPTAWQREITDQIYAAFPSAMLEPQQTWSVFDTPGKLAGAHVSFSPPAGALRAEEFVGNDPLQPLLEVLAGVSPSERLCLQLLLTSAARPRSLGARAIISLHDTMITEVRRAIIGKSFHEDAPEDEPDDKAKNAPFRANLRVIALSVTESSARAVVRRAVSAYHQFAIPGKTKVHYQIPKQLEKWIETALLRRFDAKSSFLINSTEAANLYHTPLRVKSFPALEAVSSTRLPVPDGLPNKGLMVGFGSYRDEQRAIYIDPADRLRHTYLIGQTGTGKSTLLGAQILQDMQNGDGCCFIDPHGEAIDWLLPRIPKDRLKDVVLFDPSDPEAVLGLNLLEWRTPQERDLLIQELILLFYKLFDPAHTGIIGPQFEHWLRSAALTITEPKVRGTLVDIPRLFTDKPFQEAAVARSDHWAVKDFWNNQMAKTADFHKSEMLNYFTSKFGSFLGNQVMYEILSAKRSAFDLRAIMDRRKILLVNLSKGRLGSLNAQLLGTLIVTKIQMAAMSRADVSAEERPPFYVYIDEFQNVVTDSFAAMLSEVRKYGVGLHLAHQYVDQLPDNIKQAVAGNVGTLMAFRLGHSDAQWLAPHFAPLTAEDLTSVAPYNYHLRTLAAGQLTTPFTVASPRAEITPQPALELALRTRVRQFAAHAKR